MRLGIVILLAYAIHTGEGSTFPYVPKSQRGFHKQYRSILKEDVKSKQKQGYSHHQAYQLPEKTEEKGSVAAPQQPTQPEEQRGLPPPPPPLNAAHSGLPGSDGGVLSKQDELKRISKHQQKKREDRVKETLRYSMVFTAGFADVLSFKMFGFYASMMTGNCIRFCTALAELRLQDALFFSLSIMSYTSGSILFQWVNRQLEYQDKRSKLQTFSIVSLSLFVMGEIMFRLVPLKRECLGPFLSAGFGFMNTLCASETAVVNFAVTGHIHKVGLSIVDSTLLGRGGDSKKTKGSRSSLKVIGIFLTSMFLTALAWEKAPPAVKTLLEAPSPPPVGLFFGILYASLLAW
eukprot:CAMPEP_0172461590 /NCGR_PEP_ID=MMETSP1065-20121228/41071_1 /TAXON_ID=265537 /ORGANISM="Amphiprora paludosa, Strain CCMP125" /LENGTH=346 /DNA_ID=CAMNT_0013216973 /DNA_START=223 /DNA_END=1260 /DNA_ORIENTATION=-